MTYTTRLFMKLTLLVAFILGAQLLIAQAPETFNWGNKKTTDILEDACRAQDGGILAIGSSDAEGWDGKDATIIKTNYKGEQVFRKRIGPPRYDDYGLAIAEDPSGKIWAGGYIKSDKHQEAWLSCRNPAGEPLWNKPLFKNTQIASVQDLETTTDGKSMAACGVREGKAWLAIYGLDGEMLFEPKIFDKIGQQNSLVVEQVSLVQAPAFWVLYGCGKNEKGDKYPFFIKTDKNGNPLGGIIFSQKKIITTGRCVLTTGGNLLGVGTLNNSPFEEDVFTLYMPAEMDIAAAKMQVFGGKRDKGRGLDKANDIIVLDAKTCLVIGTTRSHKPGTQTSNMATWRVDHYGQRLDYDMADYGDKLEENAHRGLRMYSGDVWLCGTMNDGGKIRDDKNFAFYKIESLTLPYAPNARPNNVQFNVPGNTPAIKPGSNGTLSVEVVNTAESPIEGMYITAECPPDMPGCYAGVRFALPPLQAGEHYMAQIPLWADREAPSSINNLKLELKNASNSPIAQKSTTLSVQALSRPKLTLLKAVAAQNDKAEIVRGKSTPVAVSIKNEGAQDAKNVVIAFAQPEGANLGEPTEFTEKVWRAGETRKYTLDVAAEEFYKKQNIDLKVFISGDNLADQEDAKASLQIVKEASAAVKEPTNVQQGKIELEIRWEGNDLQRRTDRERYEMNLDISGNREVDYGDIWIIHNRDSFPLSGAKSDEVQLPKKNKSTVYHIYKLTNRISLKPGDNLLQVVVKKGGKRFESAAMTVKYRANASTLYVLCVGVPDASGRLKHTQKDARDMATLMMRQTDKSFGNVEVKLLTTPDSTQARNISKAIKDFRLMARRGLLKPTDAILIFISTHGIVSEENGQYRIWGSDFDSGDEKYTSLSLREDVVTVIDTLPCPKIILLDACYSGAFVHNGSTRVLASCGAEEKSWEDDAWQNGAFTKAIKDILNDPAACQRLDTDGKKGLSINELFTPLQKQVGKLVKDKKGQNQTPFAPGSALGDRMQVWGY